MDISLIDETGHGAGHDGDVVDAAGINRRLDQGLGREGGTVSMRLCNFEYVFVRQHFGEPVGTEQQHIADEDVDRKEIDLQDWFKPDRTGQHVAVWMAGSLLRSEAALAHIVVNEGVVSGQLRDASRPDEIRPTVADIEHKESRGGQRHQMGHHQRRSHPVDRGVTISIGAHGIMSLFRHSCEAKRLLLGMVLVEVVGIANEAW